MFSNLSPTTVKPTPKIVGLIDLEDGLNNTACLSFLYISCAFSKPSSSTVKPTPEINCGGGGFRKFAFSSSV